MSPCTIIGHLAHFPLVFVLDDFLIVRELFDVSGVCNHRQAARDQVISGETLGNVDHFALAPHLLNRLCQNNLHRKFCLLSAINDSWKS